MQYYTQRFGVTGWARAHPGKSITRSSGSLSSYVVLARQLTDFQISAHCTQPSSEQVTMLADVPKQACVPLNTSPKTAAPGLASYELRLTNGWCDERANGCQGREIVCRSEKCGSSKRERNLFFQIAHAIQFKGTSAYCSQKSPGLNVVAMALYLAFIFQLRSGSPEPWESPERHRIRGSSGEAPSAWGSLEGVGISGRT